VLANLQGFALSHGFFVQRMMPQVHSYHLDDAPDLLSGGIRVRQVCIGSPKTRTRRSPRCAATDSPNGPAPTTATSSRSATAITSM
jgi:hypothetical protein